MATLIRPTLSSLCIALLALSFLSSCSSASKGPGGKITKVKQQLLIPTERFRSTDRSINFERQYLLRGAVTAAEQRSRTGHYYAFNWKVEDRSQPVTVLLEFRQAETGGTIHSLRQEVTDVRRNNWTKFQIVGSDYYENGRVSAWKVSLLRGKELLVSQQSYLWE